MNACILPREEFNEDPHPMMEGAIREVGQAEARDIKHRDRLVYPFIALRRVDRAYSAHHLPPRHLPRATSGPPHMHSEWCLGSAYQMPYKLLGLGSGSGLGLGLGSGFGFGLWLFLAYQMAYELLVSEVAHEGRTWRDE